MLQLPKPTHPTKPLVSLAESYELCRRITEKYSKTFYLGTLLMPKAKRQAIWAIYVWCRRTDELVDGLGIANQLTNILRDVGEDVHRGRIYLPLEDLERFNYSEDDLLKGVNDHRWQALMRFQIERARYYYDSAERGIRALNPDSRWPVWAALLLYQGILDVIEANNYDVFARRAFVPLAKKMLYLPVAWLRSQAL